MDSLANA